MSPGTFPFVAPPNTTELLVRVTGGGGAANYGNNWFAGGGGGQGGTLEAIVPASGGDTFSVTVGAGGAGGIGYGSGPPLPQPGGASTFSLGASTLITAGGGAISGPLQGCPNTGEPGGAGGSGSVASPAIGLLLTPGAAGALGQSDPGCGSGNGSGGLGAAMVSWVPAAMGALSDLRPEQLGQSRCGVDHRVHRLNRRGFLRRRLAQRAVRLQEPPAALRSNLAGTPV